MRVFGLGPTELIIILVIVIILFGPGRLGKVMGELGNGLRAFRDNMSADEKKEEKPKENDNSAEPK